MFVNTILSVFAMTGGDRGAVGGDRGVQPMSRRGMLLDTRCVNRLTGNLSTRLSAE